MSKDSIQLSNLKPDANLDQVYKLLNEPQTEEEIREEDKILLQPYDYFVKNNEKNLYPELLKAFNYWFKLPADKLDALTEIVEMNHNAIYMIRDIGVGEFIKYENDDKVPQVHYGMPMTLNASQLAYFLSLEKLFGHLPSTDRNLSLKAVTVYTDQILDIHKGLGVEVYNRDTVTYPMESEYLEYITMKIGGIVGLGVKLMQLFSGNKQDTSKLIATLGQLIHIRKDYNLKLKDFEKDKSPYDDITEGRFSYPIIHGIKQQGEDPKILYILRKRSKIIELKVYVNQLLEKLGSWKYTLDRLNQLDQEARNEMQKLGGNPELDKILDTLKVIE